MATPSSRQSLSLRERGSPPSRRRSRPEYPSRPSDSKIFARDRQRSSPQHAPASRTVATSRHRASPQRHRAESSSGQRYRDNSSDCSLGDRTTASSRASLREFRERDTQIGTTNGAMLHAHANVGPAEQTEW